MTDRDNRSNPYAREVASELQGLIVRLDSLHGRLTDAPDVAELAQELVDAVRDVKDVGGQLHDRATYFERLMVEERRRYQHLFHGAPDAYIVTSASGLILAANDAAADLLGRPHHHLLGKPLAVFVVPEARREFRTKLLRIPREERHDLEIEIETRSGRRQVEARASGELQPEGTVQVGWILRDVTARRQAEAALSLLNAELEARIAERTREVVEASARLDTVVRELPLGVLILDSKGEIQLMNRHAEEFLGLRVDEINRGIQTNLWDVRELGGREIPEQERPLARALRSGEATYNERVQVDLHDGRQAIIEGSVVPVEVEDGVVAVVLTFQDVTDREQRERAERNFVTNAAHELQTPIAAITSGIQVLQAGAKEAPADRDRFLAHIEAACTRLDRLTRALLVLARAQAGHERPRAELIPVEPLLNGVARALSPDVEISVTCPDDLAVIANKPLLEQALANLGANAVKYTNGRVLLAAERDNGRVWLHVRDDGSGIAPEERARVFERFYRGDDNGGGFGLGLAIVAEAVRAINGELELESDDAGTAFSISLPGASIIRK